MNVRLIAFLTMLLALVAIPARAYTPPPMTAHVTDAAGKLTEEQRVAIDRKLEDYRVRTSNEIAVFLPKSLEGESVEEVAVETGRAWGVGVKREDNGVLLVIAPVERKAWIATGKGAEGALTDLQADEIYQKLRPRLARGHEDYAGAIDAATDAIMADLDAGGLGGKAKRPPPKPATAGDVFFGLVLLAFIILVPILFLVLIARGFVSLFSSNGRRVSTGWASGSSWSNDSSWSSSSNDSSWSSGDSGYTGGGGDFGGGGAGGDF